MSADRATLHQFTFCRWLIYGGGKLVRLFSPSRCKAISWARLRLSVCHVSPARKNLFFKRHLQNERIEWPNLYQFHRIGIKSCCQSPGCGWVKMLMGTGWLPPGSYWAKDHHCRNASPKNTWIADGFKQLFFPSAKGYFCGSRGVQAALSGNCHWLLFCWDFYEQPEQLPVAEHSWMHLRMLLFIYSTAQQQ